MWKRFFRQNTRMMKTHTDQNHPQNYTYQHNEPILKQCILVCTFIKCKTIDLVNQHPLIVNAVYFLLYYISTRTNMSSQIIQKTYHLWLMLIQLFIWRSLERPLTWTGWIVHRTELSMWILWCTLLTLRTSGIPYSQTTE